MWSDQSEGKNAIVVVNKARAGEKNTGEVKAVSKTDNKKSSELLSLVIIVLQIFSVL